MPAAYDSMIGAHLFGEELPIGIKDQASFDLGVANWGKGVQQFGEKDKPPTELWGKEGMALYCARDTGYSHLLYETQRERFRDPANQHTARLLRDLILPGLDTISQMEMNGIWVDFDRVDKRTEEIRAKCASLHEGILSQIPASLRLNDGTVDLGDENFLRAWIFGKPPEGLGMTAKAFTAKKHIAQVDEKALAEMDHPALRDLVEWRRGIKGEDFFTQWREWSDPIWRLHPYFNPTGTVTGRRSADRPNLQQVPRDSFYRSCLGAPPGWLFLEVDYSQIEVRLAAWYAMEDTMLRVFSDPHGDIYSFTAAALMHTSEADLKAALKTGEKWAATARQKAKAVVLGLLYGMQAKKLGLYAKQTFGLDMSPQECEEFRDTFFTLYPKLLPWHERQRMLVHENKSVESFLGRTRHLLRVLSVNKFEMWKAERQAINSPVQGMGGDLLLSDMVKLGHPIYGTLPPSEAFIVGDVHDALLFQIREDVWQKWTKTILETMESPPILEKFGIVAPLRLKAEAKLGHYWSEPGTVDQSGKKVKDFSLDDVDSLSMAA